MKSAIATTLEFFDTEIAVQELGEKIREQMPGEINGIGMLFASLDYEWDEFLPALSKNLGVEIVGATGEAMLSSMGYQEEGAVLMVLSDANCRFGKALCNDVANSDSWEANVKKAYDTALAGLGGLEPKLALVYATVQGFNFETCFHMLKHHSADRVPIFGAIASDLSTYSETRIFEGNKAHDAGFVLVLIGGDCDPVFEIRSVPRTKIMNNIVTEAERNIVKKIDGKPAYDFVMQHSVPINDPVGLQFTPLCLEGEDGKAMTCRIIKCGDKSTGEVETFGDIPVGTHVTIQNITHEDISKTAKECLQALLQKIGPREGVSTILGMTCCGRHQVLGAYRDEEGKMLLDGLPQKYTFAGFYSSGEICPLVSWDGDDRPPANMFHNLSFTLCAI